MYFYTLRTIDINQPAHFDFYMSSLNLNKIRKKIIYYRAWQCTQIHYTSTHTYIYFDLFYLILFCIKVGLFCWFVFTMGTDHIRAQTQHKHC